MHPEDKARLIIDKKLEESGWVLQDYKGEFNPSAAAGVIVRDFPTSTGPADYAIFVSGDLVGIIEAKEDNKGEKITTVEEQSVRYLKSGVKGLINDKRRFTYEATSVLIRFTDHMDINPRSREVFSFHRPETLKELLSEGENTVRNLMKKIPPLDDTNFRKCQTTAINGLDKSFADNRPRALVQMTTGAGKTFTAITETYRLLRYCHLKRVLFLVDTRNLGSQADEEFRKYRPNDDARLFPELYNIVHLQSGVIPEDTHVCISTIQRMYSILRGEPVEDGSEDVPLSEVQIPKRPKEVSYNSKYPVEFFDLIIVDECHRSIYNVWKQVLDYFDAFIVGLTATPDSRTFGFFNGNLVSEYTHEEAVRDGVNVDGDTYVIKTDVTEHGGVILERFVERRNRLTRKRRWEMSDEDIEYSPSQLDKDVVNPSQIRTVIKAFHDKLFSEIFPGRSEVPKTLIFAKTDSHADDIIQVVREEFAEGNEFCKKLTYRSEEDPQSVLSAFRNDYYPRVAVTVDMITAGTDIKGLECLIFMRDVRSAQFYTQMWGRGVRTFSKDDLQKISPSARNNKERYVLVDAVGVSESIKTDNRPLERKQSVSLSDLMMSVVLGTRDEDTLTSLAGRLLRLNAVLVPKEAAEFEKVSGRRLSDVAGGLLDCFDEDVLRSKACERFGVALDDVSPEQAAEVQRAEADGVCSVFSSAEVRGFIEDVRKKHDQVIDSVNQDSVLSAGWVDVEFEEAKIESFKSYIFEHRDEIAALSVIYSQSYRNRGLTFDMVEELAGKLRSAGFDFESVWRSYELCNPKRIKVRGGARVLADVVSLVRFAFGFSEFLAPFADGVNRRFMEWTLARNAGFVHFSEEQMVWLRMIRDHIASSVDISRDDLELPPFDVNGGLGRFYELFGADYLAVLSEMNVVLVG